MLDQVDSGMIEERLEDSHESQPATSPGPLFKEIYAGVVDVDDLVAFQSVVQNDTRSFLAHTTDIQTLEQFHVLHQLPEKWGTAFHHKAYVATLESLKS